MNHTSRKGMGAPIDILKLYAKADTGIWNLFLTKCLNTHNVRELVDVRHRLQQGMAKLEKQKLNTEDVSVWFIRLQKSVDDTLKKIWRAQNPNPHYDPLSKGLPASAYRAKKQSDNDFERWLLTQGF